MFPPRCSGETPALELFQPGEFSYLSAEKRDVGSTWGEEGWPRAITSFCTTCSGAMAHPTSTTKSTTRVALRWSVEASPTSQQCTGLGNACSRRSSHRALFPGLEVFSASYAELPLKGSAISNIFPFSGPPLYGPSAAGHRPQHPHRPDWLRCAEAEQTPSPQKDGAGRGLAASSSYFIVVAPSSCWTGPWCWARWFPALAPARRALAVHHEEGARRP